MNIEKNVTTHQVYNQKLSQVNKKIQVIIATNIQPIIKDSINDLSISIKNNFFVILLNQNFSSITNVE